MNTPLSILLALSTLAPLAVSQVSALQQAILAEEREHDLARAEELYRQAFEAAGLSESVRARAGLRLGKLLQRLGKVDAAREVLGQAAQLEDPAGRAAREILEQDPEGEARTRALRAKARELLAGDATEMWDLKELDGQRRADLLWMGAAATPELIAAAHRIVEDEAKTTVNGVLMDPLQAGVLLRMAFEAGGEGALEVIQSAPASDRVEWRLAVASGLSRSMAEPEMMDTARRLLADPAPQVVMAALQSVGTSWPAEALMSLVDHPSADVRESVERMVRFSWAQLRHPEGDASRTVELLLVKVRKMLRSVDPAMGRSGTSLLTSPAMMLTSASRTLLLNQVPDIEVLRHQAGVLVQQPDVPLLATPTEHLDRLVELARRLGPPIQKLDGSQPATLELYDWQRFVDRFAELCSYQWSAEGLPQVLELLELGYGITNASVALLCTHAGDDMALEMARLTQSVGADRRLLEWLGGRALPPEAWSSLRQLLPEVDLKPLASPAAQTGHPEALAWLERTAMAEEEDRKVCQWALTLAAQREDESGEARAALRRIATATGDWQTLILLGDRESIAGIVATARGLGDREENSLAAHLLDSDDNCGYSMADRTALLREVAQHGVPLWENPFKRWEFGGGAVPVEIMDALVDAALASDALLRDGKGSHTTRFWRRALRQDPARYVRRALGSGKAGVINEALEVAHEVEDLELSAIADAARAHDLVSLGTLAAETQDEERARAIAGLAMASNSADVRRWLFQKLDSRWILTEEQVLAGLRDADENVRYRAVLFLGSDLAKVSDPLVNELLRIAESDQSGDNRTEARKLLATLREFREQKAYWARVFDGTDTTPASAAAALLRQAKDGNKEVRVLAIRSLGSLGAPEALPFLIDWTQDGDAEIAAAATEAIRVIHSKDGD